jgi:NADH:ubiquinone oxidoreductase subunit E
VPVKYRGAFKKQIKDIEINHSRQWEQKLIKTIIHHYHARPGFAAFWEPLHEILKKDHQFLFDTLIEIIMLILPLAGD